MINNTSERYGLVAILMHWLTALTVFLLFGLGLWMVTLDYYSPWYKDAPHLHKSIGVLLALFIGLRLLWKLIQSQPRSLAAGLEHKAATIAHGLLYVLLLCMFVSGYLIPTGDGRGIEVFDWFLVPSLGEFVDKQEDLAGFVHEWLAYGLMALVALHALAACKHHFINKDKTLVRMLKP